MPIVLPTLTNAGLIKPNGSVEGPIGNVLRQLVASANAAGTSVNVAALDARITALESGDGAWSGHGTNGITVLGDSTIGLNIRWTGTTDNVPEGLLNLYYTDARAKLACVADAIADGVLTVAPSQNAVFDALALKASTDNGQTSTTAVLSVNADTSKYNVAAGSGVLGGVAFTWAAQSAIVATYLASATLTYIYVSAAGSVVQSTDEPTPESRRANLYLGQLGHTSGTTIANAVNSPDFAPDSGDQFRDWLRCVGIYSCSGNVVSANGANLSINVSAGELFGAGVNSGGLANNPNEKSFTALTPATFRRRTINGQGANGTTTFDVGNYDNGTAITAIAGTKYQNFHVFRLVSGNIIVQYGRATYNSMANALDGIGNEGFVPFSNVTEIGAEIGIVSVRSTATDLSDTAQARFSSSIKIGGPGATPTVIDNAAVNTAIEEDPAASRTSLGLGSAKITDLGGLAYTGNALKVVRVNAGETAWELAASTGASTPTGTGLYGVTAGAMDAAAVTIGSGLALTAGVLSASGGGGGAIVQIERVTLDTEFTTSATIPVDDTKPQITEGALLFTVPITVTDSANDVFLEMDVSTLSGSGRITFACFKNGAADAVNANDSTGFGSFASRPHRLTYIDTAPLLGLNTYTCRVGGDGSGVDINKVNSASLYGANIPISYASATEYVP